MSVWLDLTNKTLKVPKCENKIIMKVTRKFPKFEKQVSSVSNDDQNIENLFTDSQSKSSITPVYSPLNVNFFW